MHAFTLQSLRFRAFVGVVCRAARRGGAPLCCSSTPSCGKMGKIQVGADTYNCNRGYRSTITVVIDAASKWTQAFHRNRSGRGGVESDLEMQVRVNEAVAKMRATGRKVSIHLDRTTLVPPLPP